MSLVHKARQSLKLPPSVIFEFEKYVLQHPDFAASILRNAVVFMQVEKDQEFNRWSRSLMEKQHKKG